jgi:8-oxo-dGTP pyrophosphatase MutT (NUDIX family)
MLFYPKNGMTFGFNCTEFLKKEFILDSTGGKWETEDENFSVTALRETHEEVGIHPDKMEIIKFLRLPISLQVTLWFILFGICKEEVCL